KMAASGLRQFFTFGAFGDESTHRPDLPPLALGRAGRSFAAHRSFVIGDTPLDIACGKASGLTTIAVATGRYSMDELREHKPFFACAQMIEFVDALEAGALGGL